MRLTPAHLPANVRWGFTHEGLKSVLHHAHPIPVGRGFTAVHMAMHWPGLAIGDAIAAARNAGALSKSGHFSGYAVRRNVIEFHILHDGTTRVLRGENRTQDDQGGFLISADALAEMSHDELRAMLRAAFSRRRDDKRGR